MGLLNKKHRFPIGLDFMPIGSDRIHTIVDTFTVTNSAGEVVELYYSSVHRFCNQNVTNSHVGDSTIARGACALQEVGCIDALNLNIE